MRKLCNKCKIEKDALEFHKDKSKKDGLHTICIECRKEYYDNNKIHILNYNKQWRLDNINYRKGYHHNNREKENNINKKYYSNNKETILNGAKINRINNLEYFLKKEKKSRDRNKENISISRRKYDEKNRDKRKVYSKMYREKNGEKIKDYFNKNKLKLNKNKNKYIKDRIKTDHQFRLKRNIKRLFSFFMKGKKYKSTFEYLNYTLEELKDHLEKQFDSNMSWSNYGKYWEIDHIIALHWFNFMDEGDIKKCWNLRNLRPLNISENRHKQSKLDIDLIKLYNIIDLLPNPMSVDLTFINE